MSAQHAIRRMQITSFANRPSVTRIVAHGRARAPHFRSVLPSPAMLARDVATTGARIRLMDSGAEDERPTLVLLHDALAGSECFARAGVPLAEHFRVVAPDFPGFGGSEKPDPQRYAYGCDAFADSVADLVAALGLGRVHVCGHGMGGGVALALAARHPALVNRLVLVSAHVYPAAEHLLERLGNLPVVGGLVWSQLVGQALFESFAKSVLYAGAKAVPEGRLASLYAAFNSPAARRAAHATIVAQADTRALVARLPRVSASSLVVWGRDDEVAPVEHGRRLSRALKGRFEVLECGRCPPDEEPESFASVVTAFLEGVPSVRVPASRRPLPHLP